MKINKKLLINTAACLISFSLLSPVMAGIVSVTMVPPNPGYGDLVNIYVTACVPNYNIYYIDMAVSSSAVRKTPGGSGQVFIVSNAGINVPRVNPNPAADDMGLLFTNASGFGTGDCTECGGSSPAHLVTRQYVVNIPDSSFFGSCGETGQLYLHVGMKDSYLGKGDWMGLAAGCRYMSAGPWSQPILPQNFTVAKSVEGTLQTTGDMLLYKVDYTYQNGAGFRIVENIPTGFTVESYGPVSITGGSVTLGNPTTWNFPSMTGQPGQKSGTVWMLLKWDGLGAGPFTNTATGSWAGTGAVNSSVTTQIGAAALKISKTQSADQVMQNQNITYYLSYEINGYRLKSFNTFDDASGVYSAGSAPPGWMSLPESGVHGAWTAEDPCGTGENYITGSSTQWPSLLLDDKSGTDTSDQFCDGMIVSDFMIGASTTFPGADAAIIIRSNGQDGLNSKFYSVIASIDNAPSPGYFMFQKCDGGCSYPAGGMPSIGAPVAGKWYRTRILVTNVGTTGQTIRAKLWERGEPEPLGWDINYTDVTALSNTATNCLGTGTWTDWRPGVNVMPGDYDDVLDSYDNFTTYGAGSFISAPYVHDDLVAGTTYMGCNGCALSGGAPRWTLPNTSFQSGSLTWWARADTCGAVSNRALINGGSDLFSNWVNADVVCWSPTATPTVTRTATPTRTGTYTPTYTVTRTLTVTATITITETFTPTLTAVSGVCAPQSAILCAAVDDMADIYINGVYIDQFPYVIWDQAGVYPKCVSLSPAQLAMLQPAGNMIAVKDLNTECCELWASWSLDITCVGGGHAYVSSDSGDPITMYHDNSACPATDAPVDGGGLVWYDPLYNSATSGVSWTAPSIVSGQKWGKRIWDPQTGDLLPALGYSTSSPAGVMDCQQLFFRQGFSLAKDATPVPPVFTISKSASRVSNITGPGDISFTVRVCNTGGGTFGNPVYVPDAWDSSQWMFNGPYGSVTDIIQGQIDQGNNGQTASWIFQAGVQSSSCYDLVYTLRAYTSVDSCSVWNNDSQVEYLGTPQAYSTVTLTNYCPPPPAFTLVKTANKTTGIAINDDITFTLQLCNTGGAAVTGTALIVDDYSSSLDTWQYLGPYYISSPAAGISDITVSTVGKITVYTVNFSAVGFTGCVDIPMYLRLMSVPVGCTWYNIAAFGGYNGSPTIVSTVVMNNACGFSPTATPTITVTPSRTNTCVCTVSFTPTRTFTMTSTHTYTMTRTITAGTVTQTRTFTATRTSTFTQTRTFTPTRTQIAGTATPSRTNTLTQTYAGTSTQTFTATVSFTITPTPVYCMELSWPGHLSGGETFNIFHGVAVDSSGYVYVMDTFNNRVQKYDSDGVYITQWGTLGTGNSQFDTAYGIGVDGSGNVYVADTTNNRIQKFNSNGVYITQWGGTGSGDGQFINPYDVRADGSGYIYVLDHDNIRVQKFDSNGLYISQWALPGTYVQMAVDSAGNNYLTGSLSNTVRKYDSNGVFITAWGGTGSGPGQFNNFAEGIAVDGIGYVYVVDTANGRVQVFDSNGVYLTQWSGIGQSFGIGVNSGGDTVYVSCGTAYLVQKYGLCALMTATSTPTATATKTASVVTNTRTPTPTRTNITGTLTYTPTDTVTATRTETCVACTPTRTVTSTATITITATFIATEIYCWADIDGAGLESIDVPDNMTSLTTRSAVWDSAGYPQIAAMKAMPEFYSDIFYFRWNGASWVDADGTGVESSNISKTTGSSTSPSICLDPAGNPNIAWAEGTSATGYKIYYLKWNGSAWVDIDGTGQESISVNNITATYLWNVQIKIDATGTLHLMWVESSTGKYDINCLKWNGSTWVDEDGTGTEQKTVVTNGTYIYYCKMKLSSSGYPNIVWKASGDLGYLKWNGSTWVDADGTGQESAVILAGRASLGTPALAFDSLQNALVSWNDSSSGTAAVYLLKWNGSAWVDVDGAGQESMNVAAGMSPDIELDVSGNPNITYEKYNAASLPDIYYERWTGSAWVDADGAGLENVKIKTGQPYSGDSAADLWLDAGQNPNVLYNSNPAGTSGLKYLRWVNCIGTPTFTLTPTQTITITGAYTPSFTYTPTVTITPTPSITATLPAGTPVFTPTVTATQVCAPVITVNLEYNPGEQDYVLAEIISSGVLTGPVSVRIALHGTSDSKQEFTFTAGLVSAGPPSIYNVQYPKSNAWGDIDGVFVSGVDACGNSFTSSGNYTKEVLTPKDTAIFKNKRRAQQADVYRLQRPEDKNKGL
jgi:hypothetical protein